METITGLVSGYIWSIPMVVLAFGVGIYLTIRLRAPQLTRIPEMIHYLTKGSSSDSGISSFQGFAMALGGRIGIGNIAGVATAIYFGGPGAVFWMWMMALIGAGTAFTESALAQVYKSKLNGEYRGGPAYYIEKGLKSPVFAFVFAILGTFSFGITGPTVQAFNIADSLHTAFGWNPQIAGAGIALCFALVVFGGMKRIGNFAQYVVPVMAIAYIILALIIMGVNYMHIGAMFKLIFGCAFNTNAFFGALWGQGVMWGVRRGIYSNEAGMGSGAHASAAAEVSHPAKQGLAQAFSVYVDTLFVCTATAIMLLSTNCFNVMGTNGKALVENLKGVDPGVGYTQAAINTFIPGLGSAFLAIAVFFFAFTTLLSFAFYADTNVTYMCKKMKNQANVRKIVMAVMVVQTIIIFFASSRTATVAWNIADVGTGLMTWANLIALIFLSPKAIRVFNDYVRQRKLGLDPVFEPEDCGIENADLWDEIVDEKYMDLRDAKWKAEGKTGRTGETQSVQ